MINRVRLNSNHKESTDVDSLAASRQFHLWLASLSHFIRHFPLQIAKLGTLNSKLLRSSLEVSHNKTYGGYNLRG